MLKVSQLRTILNNISYRDDWKLVLKKGDGFRYYLQVQFKAKDSTTGRTAMQHSRKWLLSPHMCTSEVVRTAYKALLAAEEHEAAEKFKYKGQSVFTPHLNVDNMAWLMSQDAVALTEVRVPKPKRKKK